MGEVADILKATHDILDGGEATVTVDARGLGMAYAIPRGSESTVVDTYGPWYEAEMRQVFYKESSIVGSVMAEIQMVMSWRYSQAKQYIIDTSFINNVISLDPTVTIKTKVHFDNPQLYDFDLEAYKIPFRVEVTFDPTFGSTETGIYRGEIRADGGGSFNTL